MCVCMHVYACAHRCACLTPSPSHSTALSTIPLQPSVVVAGDKCDSVRNVTAHENQQCKGREKFGSICSDRNLFSSTQKPKQIRTTAVLPGEICTVIRPSPHHLPSPSAASDWAPVGHRPPAGGGRALSLTSSGHLRDEETEALGEQRTCPLEKWQSWG